jgi:hypothetical protein
MSAATTALLTDTVLIPLAALVAELPFRRCCPGVSAATTGANSAVEQGGDRWSLNLSLIAKDESPTKARFVPLPSAAAAPTTAADGPAHGDKQPVVASNAAGEARDTFPVSTPASVVVSGARVLSLLSAHLAVLLFPDGVCALD